MTKGNELVTLIDESRAIEVTNKDKLREYLNNAPPKSWIKKHPLAKDVDYVPIDKTEALLDAIFQDWQVEIKSVMQLAQAICAIVRLHYRDPVTGEWKFHDGVGAVDLKTKKGAAAADLSQIIPNAVGTGAPAAVSLAIKDAADHIGKIFGRDLNRKDTINLKGFYNAGNDEEEDTPSDVQKALEAFEAAKTINELKSKFDGLPLEIRADKRVIARKNELKQKFLEKTDENSAD